MANVNINALASQLSRELALYSNGVGEEIQDSAKKIARKGARILRNTSPDRTGNYKSGWRATKVGNRWVINNRVYQLTHLLENGHAGKNNNPPVNPVVHIRPVEELVINDFLQDVERILRG